MEQMTPKPFVFVLMPFAQAFDDIYEVGIKAACIASGAYCERVDEQIFDGSVLERVYNQIARADIIVADMSKRNANVFYETGYAHALGKRVILLTQEESDIPFDLKHYPHIIYGSSIARLKVELEKRILWCIQHPKDSLSKIEFNMQIFISGINIKDEKDKIIKCKSRTFWDSETNQNCEEMCLNLVIHNPTTRMWDGSAVKFGIVTAAALSSSTGSKNIAQLPDGRYIHLLPVIGSIFPDGWESVEIRFRFKSNEFHRLEEKLQSHDPHEIIVRVFTEIGSKDFPIRTEWTSA